MKFETIDSLIGSMTSDFLFLDEREIDVPSAGKFLNQLEGLIKEAEEQGIGELKEVAAGMTGLLEKVIFDALPNREQGFVVFEKGVSTLPRIIDDYKNFSTCKSDLTLLREDMARILGKKPDAEPVASTEAPSAPPVSEAAPEAVAERPAVCAEGDGDVEPIEKLENVQDESLLRDFITEGLEYIDEIEVNILNLEQSPEDKEYINTIFRPFHSIKGVASFLNLDKIRTLAHNLENLLDKARNGELRVTPPLIDVILDGADALKTMISQLKDQLECKPINPLKVDLADLIVRIQKLEKGVQPEAKVKKLGEILIDEGVISKEDLDKTLQETPREKKLGEVLIEEGKVTPKQVSQALRKQTEQATDMSTIRVDIRKLDDMIDMVGELVITQSMVQQGLANYSTADRNLMRDISQLFRITSGLQRVSTGLRMIPIKQTFQRMSRLVRDLGKNAGKVIAVELVGEDTEIDRNMVDEIYNPLVHMIRNSVDHGLETPADRIAAGKPEKGLIQLKAYHGGGRVVIEISDDGRGLNKEKIINKAIKNGAIHSAEGLSDQDIFKLIFLPGLSTAEKVTDVSGRGVGMDVVRQSIEKLRGKAEIESTFGKGTTFITRFPLTMAIIDGMIVKVGTERYILPTTAIRQTLRPSKESINTVVGRGETVNVMGQLLPLVRLYELFNIEPEQIDPVKSIAVVVEGENRSKCLLVDSILGKAEVVIKSLGEGLTDIKGVSGGAILGDGNIGLILDPEGLFELSESL